MAANRAIRNELVKRLGNITKQSLSNRVKNLKQRLPMTTADAVYVLAHQQKIDVGRHLDPTTLDRVVGYVSRLGSTASTPATQGKSSKPVAPRVVRITIAGLNLDQLPGLTEAHAREAKVMAEKVFPALYVFENSARDIISRILTASLGTDWWEQIVPTDIKDKVAGRITKEKDDPWHSSRGAHPLQYTDLPELPRIINAPRAWPYFKEIFPSQGWVLGVFDDMNVSRRVVAHMNPLLDADITQVEAGLQRWARQLRAKEAELA